MTEQEPSPEFYKSMYNAKVTCWCGGDLELTQDGAWWVQKCKSCGNCVRAYMVMLPGGYAR